LSLSMHNIKKRSRDLPQWWDPMKADAVCRAIISKDSIVESSDSFRKHLETIYDSLQSVAEGRGALAETLKECVEKAHVTLLKAVEGESEAKEAYDSFHNALFCLPSLSKEIINACIDEMNLLVSAVDAMAQSEIEALTVVWEALSIRSSERERFWFEVEDANKKAQSRTNGAFDNIRHKVTMICVEEWVISSIKNAAKVQRSLSAGLDKLSRIHQEVETLRSKQDAKSKIISLDSELCILSAKLSEFEDRAKGKLTKKGNSASLLKDERFRKHMQSNFSLKLATLGILLRDWEKEGGSNFENILSENVRMLLRDPDKRTAFMHLKTVQKKTRKAHERIRFDVSPTDRSIDTHGEHSVHSQSSNLQNSSNNTQLKVVGSGKDFKRRITQSSRHQVKHSPFRGNLPKKNRALYSPQQSSISAYSPLSTKNMNKRKHLLSSKAGENGFSPALQSKILLPFGNVLATTPTKENTGL